MIDINVVNVFTILLISVVGIAAVKMALNAIGMSPDWL